MTTLSFVALFMMIAGRTVEIIDFAMISTVRCLQRVFSLGNVVVCCDDWNDSAYIFGVQPRVAYVDSIAPSMASITAGDFVKRSYYLENATVMDVIDRL